MPPISSNAARVFLLLAAGGLGSALAGAARADVLKVDVGQSAFPAAEAPLTALTLTDADVGAASFTTGAGAVAASVAVSTIATQGVVKGSADGLHIAPGPQPDGGFAGAYLSTGFGSIDIAFTAGTQTELALLWGSVDPSNEAGSGLGPNYLTFKRAGAAVATYSSDDLRAAAFTELAGTDISFDVIYAVLTDTSGAFDEVVLSSAITSFEAAGLSVGSRATSVSEPAALTALGTGLLGLSLLRRRKAPARL